MRGPPLHGLVLSCEPALARAAGNARVRAGGSRVPTLPIDAEEVSIFSAWGGLPGRIWFVYVWRTGRQSGPPVVNLISGEAADSVCSSPCHF